MITKLQIKNFQSHKDTTLDFSSGVNAIIGPSDSGKTAILRALRWVLFNLPSGDAFRSWWGGKTSVAIEVDDHVIERAKDKGKNTYVLDDSEFSSFGTAVPEPVQKVVNVDKINWQSQFDSSFMLSSSPAECSRMLNEVANLDLIDTSLSRIDSMLREARTQSKLLQKSTLSAQETLSKYEGIESIGEVLKTAEKIEKDVVLLERKHESLLSLIEDYEQARETLSRISIPKEIPGIVEQANAIQKKGIETKDRLMILREMIENYETCLHEYRQIDKQFERVKQQLPKVCPTCGRPFDE